jgi:Tol biopolymer transport system component
MNADGAEQRLLCPEALGGFVFPDWSPDGKRIVLSKFVEAEKANHLYLLEVATGALTPLVEAPGFQTFARWSPDGRYIAYATFSERPVRRSRGDLMIVDVESKENWTVLKGQVPGVGARPCWLAPSAPAPGESDSR